MNGTFFLPQKLQATASSLGGTAASGGAVGGSAAPTALLNYAGPVSNDAVTLSVQADDRCDGRAAYRRLQQDADVHAVAPRTP